MPCSGWPAGACPSQTHGADQLPFDGSTVAPPNNVSRTSIGPWYEPGPLFVTVIVKVAFCPVVVTSLGPAIFSIVRLVCFPSGVLSGGSGSPMAGERHMPSSPPSGRTGAKIAAAELISSPAKELSSVPPGAFVTSALFVTSHCIPDATGTLTFATISALPRCGRLGLSLLHW